MVSSPPFLRDTLSVSGSSGNSVVRTAFSFAVDLVVAVTG